MKHFPVFNKYQILSASLIALTALLGDKFGASQKHQIAAAVWDNVTHAAIGCFSWLEVVSSRGHWAMSTSIMIEIALCGMFSSVIDLDHFICAKSFYLSEATNLGYRPFMHSTSGLLLSTVLLLFVARILTVAWLEKTGWIFLVAFLSHHIRDSCRRGFWIWPFGSTSPTPYSLYIIELICLPIFTFGLIHFTSPLSSNSTENIEFKQLITV